MGTWCCLEVMDGGRRGTTVMQTLQLHSSHAMALLYIIATVGCQLAVGHVQFFMLFVLLNPATSTILKAKKSLAGNTKRVCLISCRDADGCSARHAKGIHWLAHISRG